MPQPLSVYPVHLLTIRQQTAPGEKSLQASEEAVNISCAGKGFSTGLPTRNKTWYDLSACLTSQLLDVYTCRINTFANTLRKGTSQDEEGE